MGKGKRGPAKGQLVPDDIMHRAAKAWIELEDAGKLSNSEIGRRIGHRRAPEWLTSDKFLQILELERFDVELAAVRGLGGLDRIVDQVLSLGLAEMFRRLKVQPRDTPYPVLFGDLTRLLKMRAELEAAQRVKTVAPASLMITIRQEVMQIPDLTLRTAVLQGIFADYTRALATVKDLLPMENPDVVDVVGRHVDIPSAEVPVALLSAANGNNGTGVGLDPDRVWSDPVDDPSR